MKPNSEDSTKPTVDIRKLKSLVAQQFPRDSAIHDILLTEGDIISVPDFLIKVDIWLRLLRRLKN
jgi:hypothetical protein